MKRLKIFESDKNDSNSDWVVYFKKFSGNKQKLDTFPNEKAANDKLLEIYKDFPSDYEMAGAMTLEDWNQNKVKVNEGFNSNSKVFVQQNTLWVAWQPNSGSTTQIQGNPDEFRGYFSSDPNDSHFNSDVDNIDDWISNNPDTIKNNKYSITKIPCYWGYKDQHDLSVWGGNIKPDYFLYLAISYMGNGFKLLNFFKTKNEAINFLK